MRRRSAIAALVTLAIAAPCAPAAWAPPTGAPTRRRRASAQAHQAAEARAVRRGARTPSRRRPPGKTASVMLADRHRRQGRGRGRRGRCNPRAPRSTRPRSRRSSSSSSSRPRSTTSRRRSRSPTATTSSSKKSRGGPIVNFEGVVRDRVTKKPTARRSRSRSTGGAKPSPTTTGHFEFDDVPAGKHAVTICGRGLHHRHAPRRPSRRASTSRSSTRSSRKEEKRRSDDDPTSRSWSSRRASRRRSSPPRSRSKKGGASPARRATRSRSCRTCPASRARRSARARSSCGARRRRTRASTSTACAIPLLYHGGGLRSTVNSDMVRAIELVARRLRRRVRPRPRRPRHGRHARAAQPTAFTATSSADVIDASAMVEAPHRRQDPRRRRRAQELPRPRSSPLVTSQDVGEFVPIPSYYDAQAKIVRDLGENESRRALPFDVARQAHAHRGQPRPGANAPRRNHHRL